MLLISHTRSNKNTCYLAFGSYVTLGVFTYGNNTVLLLYYSFSYMLITLVFHFKPHVCDTVNGGRVSAFSIFVRPQ